MSYRNERDEFISRATTAGLHYTTAQLLLRHATTLQRLAEAQCNGDWPFDNGERKVIPCPKCAAGTVPSQIKGSTYLARGLKACPDCRTSAAVQVLLSDTAMRPVFGGDPRGAVLKLVPKDTPEEDVQNGRERGIYVPAGGR